MGLFLLGAASPVPPLRFAIDQDYTPQSETPTRVARDFTLIHALGVHILRSGIGWDDTNPRPETFKWHYWSQVTSLANASGITLRPYYAYTPAWAGAAYNKPPYFEKTFAKACAVMAAILGDRVKSFEVWNEPDNSAFWTGNPTSFGDLFGSCADNVHAVRPEAKVVLGGLVYLDSDFYKHAIAVPGVAPDIAAFHEYTETPWDATTVERDNSHAYFDGGYDGLSASGRREVWMDEGGASTAAKQGYDEQSQSSWIRRTVISLIGHPGRPLSLIGLYQLRDPNPRTKPIGDQQAQIFFHHTGLFTNDGRPKLAARTTADLVRLLDGHQPTPASGMRYVVTSGKPSQLMRLYDLVIEDGHQVICIWDRNATSSGRIVLPTPGKTAFLHWPNGRVEQLPDFDGQAIPISSLSAGDIPLLFEVR